MLENLTCNNSDYINLCRNNSVLFSFFLEPVSDIEVAYLIDTLSTSKSRDYYGLNSDSIRIAKNELLPLLTYFINFCFEKGIFPNCLKKSKVTPIFKNGNKNEVSNHRPISIIPILSKLLELAFNVRLMLYLENNNLLNPCQFGYRKSTSTVKALTEMVVFITDALEKGHIVAASFLDLSKAFDCVSPDILIIKLESLGIRGSALSFIKSYMTDRHQCVCSNGEISSLQPLKFGVPQGSILGPTLFIVYINDISDHISSKVITYADDSTLLSAHNNMEDLTIMSADAQLQARLYFSNVQLSLNSQKTQNLIFSLNTRICINNNSPVKCLGITLDSKLTWESQIHHVSKNLSSKIFLLKKLKNQIDENTILMAYHALFHSIMCYGILLWGGSAHRVRILKLQKKAIRVISNAGYNESCRPLFKKLCILTCTNQYILECILFARNHLSNYLVQGSYKTRNESVVAPFFRLSKNINSFRYLSIKFYNLLPNNWKILNDIAFAKKVKSFLKENVFYEIDEFIIYFNRF